MDTQSCKLEIESYGYDETDLIYYWGRNKTDHMEDAVTFAEFMLPQFSSVGYRVNATKQKEYDGVYVKLFKIGKLSRLGSILRSC